MVDFLSYMLMGLNHKIWDMIPYQKYSGKKASIIGAANKTPLSQKKN